MQGRCGTCWTHQLAVIITTDGRCIPGKPQVNTGQQVGVFLVFRTQFLQHETVLFRAAFAAHLGLNLLRNEFFGGVRFALPDAQTASRVGGQKSVVDHCYRGSWKS